MELFTWMIPTEMVLIVLGGIAYIILSIVKWRYCYKKYKMIEEHRQARERDKRRE